MKFLNKLAKMANKAVRDMEAQQRKSEALRRKFEAQQRKSEALARKQAQKDQTLIHKQTRKKQAIVASADRLVDAVHSALRNAANSDNRITARVAKIKSAKEKLATLRQLACRYSFLNVSGLDYFEKEVIRIESLIHTTQTVQELRKEEEKLDKQRKREEKLQEKVNKSKTEKKKIDKPEKIKTKPHRVTTEVSQTKTKKQVAKADIFKYDPSFECLRLPRNKQ